MNLQLNITPQFTPLKSETPIHDRIKIEKLDLYENHKINEREFMRHEVNEFQYLIQYTKQLRQKWKK